VSKNNNHNIQPKIPNQQQYQSPKVQQEQGAILQVSHSYSGPIPSPEVLAAYEAISPGAAQKIIEMAQNQSTHRIKLEEIVVVSREKQSQRGQYFAFILTLALIACAVYALYIGAYKIASIIISITVIAVATLFITGKASQTKQPKQNNNQSK
jgi:Predicted membrane protein